MEELTAAGVIVATEVIKSLAKDMATFLKEKATSYYKDTTNKEMIESGWAFEDYMRKVYGEYSKSKSIIYLNEPVELSKFFIPADLRFERTIPPRGTVSLTKAGDHTISGKHVEDVLERSNKIIITGIGGLGKTMHMKHFCVDAIEEEYKIPIYIQLRWFNVRDLGDKPFEKLIYERLVDFGFKLKEEYFFESLDSDKYLFLFDGFDEVSKDKRSQISILIERFAQHYSENCFIISSRKTDDIYSWENFTIYSLCKLGYEQAAKLIWKLDFPDERKKKFIGELNDGLYEKYEEFVSVPILLSILFITYLDHATIPANLQDFYETAFFTMMSRHDNLKVGFKREFESQLSYTDFKKVFTRFCFITYFNDEYSFPEHRLVDNIELVLSVVDVKFDVQAFKRDLVDISCMLMKDGLEYAFIHRNFQEYFAAKYLSVKGEKEQSRFCADFIKDECGEIREIGKEGALEPMRDKVIDFFDVLYSINPERFEIVVLKPILNKLFRAYEECGNDLYKLAVRYFHIHYLRVYSKGTILCYIYFKTPFWEEGVNQFNPEEYNVLCHFYQDLYFDERNELNKDIMKQIGEDFKSLSGIFGRVDDVAYTHIRTEQDSFPDSAFKVVCDLLTFFTVVLRKYNDLYRKDKENSVKVGFKRKIVKF